jgi:hypothetical protein
MFQKSSQRENCELALQLSATVLVVGGCCYFIPPLGAVLAGIVVLLVAKYPSILEDLEGTNTVPTELSPLVEFTTCQNETAL